MSISAIKDFKFLPPINNQSEFGSSSFIFDLRNYTKTTREISWDDRWKYHICFMKKLNETVYRTLYGTCDYNDFAFNDTGDGYLFIFWDKFHALTCLKIAIKIKDFLDNKLKDYNENVKRYKYKSDLDYGFALHSGGSTICRAEYNHKEGPTKNKDFFYGIVLNTTTKLEKFTKNPFGLKFLVTGNYKECFLKQVSEKNKKAVRDLFEKNSDYIYKSVERFDIKDSKKKGHYIYALKDEFIDQFIKICS